ncbi:MAG: ATP-binding protein [Fibrobacteria bacterium]|nr:ATP-binding protein [Fibrobacteria bacterium]
MERDLDNILVNWAKKKHRKPILLRGARQTGKTYAVEVLAKTFTNFCCLNFERKPTFKKIFEPDLDPIRIIKEIETIFEVKIKSGRTLLFFDEIQNCPPAITAMRYFYEEVPDIHLIGAGSLLEFALDSISVPVGRLKYIHVKPFCFSEYLNATGKPSLAKAITNINYENPPTEIIHQTILNELRDYLFLGGMPGVLKTYLNTNSIIEACEEQDDIIATYRDDFNKYCGRAGTTHLDSVFDTIPRYVGKRVAYSKLEPDAKSEQVKRAITLLEKAHVLLKVKATSGGRLPLASGVSQKKYKLIMLDTGLMQRMIGASYQQWKEKQDLFPDYAGSIAEQFIGQELSCLTELGYQQQLFYWERSAKGSSAEIDYLFAINGRAIPIEVKSSAFGHLKSLQIFLKTYPHITFGIKFSEQNFQNQGSIKSIPLYCISQLKRLA